MIVGIGTDLVGVVRFEAVLARTPDLVDRVFCPEERVTGSGGRRTARSLAARFAAKEAAAKALGAPAGCGFRDCEVISGPDGRPTLRITGVLARHAERLRVRRWHVSLTHDANLAAAVVVAEGDERAAARDESAEPATS
ncbi:holo-[acyl-carrier protein] synthase [Actinoalloteichus hoggarensis]|uniref:Holo-[acyl-carrier-protein] synthase n=1 Tax=Actinoalloteichus hoggarensis TaxID=1470176 RepID=A0A221W9U1_9PSEU|nr:holo-ACP synthase [Actinoalloteichus hoggarensis]ASO22762.1 Holo-[acyl-carrier-protein] synthase [Actinoalloteichus hoggarensis]MBB5924096.1 holo-[acyl-carrier protein] synthase [Actinoalloteichus hoggarensis]